jgi:hypothetical protein
MNDSYRIFKPSKCVQPGNRASGVTTLKIPTTTNTPTTTSAVVFVSCTLCCGQAGFTSGPQCGRDAAHFVRRVLAG